MSDTLTEYELGKGLTIESIWALFRETDAQRKEYNREIKEKFAEVAKMQAENAAQIKELGIQNKELGIRNKELGVRIEELGVRIEESRKNIDGLNNALGNWTEEMVRAQLWEKFRKIGFQFTKGGKQTFKNKKNQVIAQVDAFLENGEYAIPVEVKSQFQLKDVDRHIEQIEVLRAYMDERSDKRKLLGGIAGAVVPEDVLHYAHKIGLYVIVQSGDSVVLARLPKNFKPREW